LHKEKGVIFIPAMKKNLTILILSIVSIAILVAIEITLILRIHKLEAEKFDFRYREILQKSLDFIERRYGDKTFEETYYWMNKMAEKNLSIVSGKQYDTLFFKSSVLHAFQEDLKKYQKVDELLRQYLSTIKEESDFSSTFEITRLKIYSESDTMEVFDVNSKVPVAQKNKLSVVKAQKPVYGYTYVGTHFSMGFNYYVDFNDKRAMVMGKILGSLILAIIALISVGIMFFVSLRSLLEERRLSQLKTDFINNMTHELKTPLSTISIATRTLENDSVLDNRDKTKETVSIIHRQNRQLTKQINHLLEISMWERKQFSLERRMLEVEPFISGIAEAFRWECNNNGCELEERYSIKTPSAYLDEVQMTIAVHNLLVNAVKYNTNQPHVLLEVTCDERLRIQVTDNGIGISREDQKHIFDKFYRVSTGNIHKVKGLGLGLFYVKQIVEAHGGTIEVTSKPGKGSTFTINLPVHGKNQNSAG
jgi:signal transduction histidine kinase